MNESISELTSTTNKDECYKESPQNFPLSQWQATSGLSPITSWPQTFDIIQDYFGGLKEESGHSLGDEVTYSVSTPFEAFEFSDFNYTDPSGSLITPQARTETFTENREKLCSGPELKSPLESLSTLPLLPKLDSGQTSTDANYNNIGFSKRLKNCADSSKREENNSIEKNTSSHFAEKPGVLLKPNINLCLTNFEQTCMKLIPIINRTNTQNYSVLLVETLRTCSKDITLQEFYNLLYNSNALASVNSLPPHQSKIDQNKNTLKLEGFKVCSFILDIFSSKIRRVNSIVSEFVKNPLLEAVNFEEVRKKFIAIKIIFDSVEIDEVLLRHKGIPRTSLYKAYSSICRQFPERFNILSKNTKLNRSAFVGAPQFGRLTRLVYPHLKLRRLGRRGNSKHHYIGIIWNKSFIDDEFLRQLSLDQPVTLAGDKEKNPEDIPGSVGAKITVFSKADPAHKIKKSFFAGFADTKYSFVLLATKVPICEFSPRDWKYFPGKSPQPSHWSRKIMERSSMALHKYDIYMKPVIQDFYHDIFSSNDSKIFLRKFIQHTNILIETNSDDEGYFHMYLIILLLIFPVILATDEEVPREDKVKLRKTLKDFVHGLDFELSNFPSSKLNYLQNFCNIVKKMIHINELSSSHIKTGLVQAIVKEISLDVQKPTAAPINLYENPLIEEILSRAVFAAANAFKSEFFTGNTPTNAPDNSEFLGNIVKAFMNCAIKNTEHLLGIPRLMSPLELQNSTFDLPFQIFKFSTRVLHQMCFSDPFISKLSIQVIRYILHMVTNELQNISFGEFGKREPELSSGTFKTWWVYSTLSGEYMKILEEIVALSARLS